MGMRREGRPVVLRQEMLHQRVHEFRFLGREKPDRRNFIDPVPDLLARGFVPEFLLTQGAEAWVVGPVVRARAAAGRNSDRSAAGRAASRWVPGSLAFPSHHASQQAEHPAGGEKERGKNGRPIQDIVERPFHPAGPSQDAARVIIEADPAIENRHHRHHRKRSARHAATLDRGTGGEHEQGRDDDR